MSGDGEEVDDTEELLSPMKEVREDLFKIKEDKKKRIEEQNKRNERLDSLIRENATKRRESQTKESTDDKEKQDCPSKRIRQSVVSLFSIEKEMESFNMSLEKVYSCRMELKEDLIKLDRERF